MFKTSVYISNGKELSEDIIIKLVESKEIEKKTEGMKCLIEYVTHRKFNNCILHTVVKEVLLMENNELKRLLYYFLEIYMPYINESEFLLLNNQIRKDLESPNEFVRGFVLKFVSTLKNPNVLNNCFKSIKDNIKHSVGYVRRNAYYCLGLISNKINMNDEICKILCESLYKEMDSLCLIQAFYSLWEIDENFAKNFAYEVSSSKSKDFSLMLIERIQEDDFLQKFVDVEDEEVRLEACLNLLDVSNDINLLEKYVSMIFRDIKQHEEYFDDVFKKLISLYDKLDLSKYVFDALNFINPFNIEGSKLCMDFAMHVCNYKDVTDILNFVVVKYKEIEGMMLKNKKMEILFIENMITFVGKYAMFNDDIMNICLKNIQVDVPALAYCSLKLLNVILENTKDNAIVNILIKNIKKIKYGKIFRLIFDILVNNCNEKHLEEIFNLLNVEFKDICHFKGKSDLLCFQLNSRYLLSFVCISITEICQKNSVEEEFKAKIIALFLGFTKLEDFCDASSKSTIFLCVKSLNSDVNYEIFAKKETLGVNSVDVFAPLEFPFISNKKHEKIEQLVSFLESPDNDDSLLNVVQLTGLSDPIYVEASISYTKYEIIIDLLLINQTDNYLQNMLFDFGTSQNIRVVSVDLPESMNGRSAVSKKLLFRVLDSSSGFINGTVTFKYPNENGEYANQIYTLNFSEIKTDVSDFLEIKRCQSEDFRSFWKKMAWENVYSIKLLSNLNLDRVFEKFVKFVKGSVVDVKKETDIIVGNIMCTTRQNDDIFFNVCIAKNDNILNLECRIRSNKEHVVKTMSDILSKVVKDIRIK